ncbi:hypothetical protein CEUSTIGMA_g12081.t1 [Chlamydomonas eustigma]|uniref:SET domain-containing protein n=1 Tax=Chlamydomonas eustigma TaxID=1157962 RepID=A0A250XPD2_9CHLO|nr:hypothetical protein CEUSTIGMA_g12081.t1 [Chlamydomonas eustigma]|eukprot:GAX84660.1 hypothetical protein CEUSTIGMA_g12081.t1 [Chlamydomonas eustigma]
MNSLSQWHSPVGLTPLDDSEQCVGVFLKWCRRNKVTFPKCKIAKSDETGRCVQACQHIKEGEVVVEVPDDAVLMAENSSMAARLEDWGLCKPAEDPILEVQGLIIAVMHERKLGKKSKWNAYLSFLPEDMSHIPMFWEDEDLEELRGTAALDKMEGIVQQPSDAPTRVKELWAEIAEPFISENPDIELPTGAEGLSLYKWATAVVSSYSFMLGDDHYQAMVPIWDALNHVTDAKNVRLHHNERRGVLQMIATQDILVGEEVVNDYGSLSNSELLRAYGFVERRSLGRNVVPSIVAEETPLPSTASSASAKMKVRKQRSTASDHHDPLKDLNPELKPRLLAAGVPGNSNSHVQVPWSCVVDGVKKFRESRKEDDAGGEEKLDTRKKKRIKSVSALPTAGESFFSINHSYEDMEDRAMFLHRHGLLPENQVFKIFHDRVPPLTLTECVRLMLLTSQEFQKFSQMVSKPHQQSEKMSVRRTRKNKISSRENSQPVKKASAVFDVGPLNVGTEGGEQLVNFYSALIDNMLSRYPHSLNMDLEVLEDKERNERLPVRKQAAVVARMDEKACWALLKVWLCGPNAASLLISQCSEVWTESMQKELRARYQKGGWDSESECNISASSGDADKSTLSEEDDTEAENEQKRSRALRSSSKVVKDTRSKVSEHPSRKGADPNEKNTQNFSQDAREGRVSGGFAFNFEV